MPWVKRLANQGISTTTVYAMSLSLHLLYRAYHYCVGFAVAVVFAVALSFKLLVVGGCF
jgi:hypothetical protein